MNAVETKQLNELWQRIAELRDEAAGHVNAFRYAEAQLCYAMIQTIRLEIHTRYLKALAIDAVYGNSI